jgi:hypothetical protein
MRTYLKSFGVAALLAGLSVSALALGVGDLAKVILGGGNVLKKAEAKCGSSLALSNDESLALTFARAAAEKALPISQFTALDTQTAKEADQQAQSNTFCTETKQKKPGMMSKIKKAGKSILKARVLGG